MTENIIACRLCGKIMPRLARDICPECFEKEEALFHKVKTILQENPSAQVADVAKFAGCTAEQVETIVRSGRLERAGIKHVAHSCQLCSEIIYDGVLCANCKRILKEQLNVLKQSTKKAAKN